MESMGKAIAYLRVSTDRQGSSGLGTEAQRNAVARFVEQARLDLVAEYVEVETAKGSNTLQKRPQLLAALNHARAVRGKLVLAKLDRLARNVHFVSGLMETGVDFAIADMPNADRFQLHLFAALAEKEAEIISQRTKAALAAAKARGTQLGKNGHVLAEQNKKVALERLEPIRGRLAKLQQEGYSIRAMADVLNGEGIASPGGGTWHASNLHRALNRLRTN